MSSSRASSQPRDLFYSPHWQAGSLPLALPGKPPAKATHSFGLYSSSPNANKMDNQEEMDKSLGRYNILRLNQEERENMNRQITSIEIKTVI